MDLELTEDQRDLRTLAREFLSARGDLQPARAFLEGEGDATALAAEVAELGWYAVGLEDDDPFGVPGLCVLAEQVGAHVAPVPLVDSAVAARLGAPAGAAALCVLEASSGWSLEGMGAEASGDGRRVSGRKTGVHHAGLAERLVVVARLEGEPAALAVAARDGAVTSRPGVDPSSATATVTFDDAPVQAVLARGADALRAAFALGAVASAAEAVGAASRALDLAIAYSLERSQFGRPIGANQALAHLMADLHVLRETAWSTVLYAAGALDEDLEDALATASVAKAYASPAARRVAEGALQVFGGVGFTWEHDAHLLARRVLECERRFGDAIDHERILAASKL